MKTKPITIPQRLILRELIKKHIAYLTSLLNEYPNMPDNKAVENMRSIFEEVKEWLDETPAALVHKQIENNNIYRCALIRVTYFGLFIAGEIDGNEFCGANEDELSNILRALGEPNPEKVIFDNEGSPMIIYSEAQFNGIDF